MYCSMLVTANVVVGIRLLVIMSALSSVVACLRIALLSNGLALSMLLAVVQDTDDVTAGSCCTWAASLCMSTGGSSHYLIVFLLLLHT